MSAPETKQLSLIPEDTINREQRNIPLSAIPEKETRGSRLPDASMKLSVQRFGILTPILVAYAAKPPENPGPDYSPTYRLLAGRRRVLAARDCGILFANAVVFPYGTPYNGVITLIENEQRSENPLVELTKIEELIARGATVDEICAAVGMDKRRLEKRLRLGNLIPELRQALTENRIAIGVAEEAAALSPEEQQKLAAMEKVRGQDVNEVRRANTSAATGEFLTGLNLSESNPEESGEETAGEYKPEAGDVVAIRKPLTIQTEAEAVAAAKALVRYLNTAPPDENAFGVPLSANLRNYIKESELTEYVSEGARMDALKPETAEPGPVRVTGGAPNLVNALIAPGGGFVVDIPETFGERVPATDDSFPIAAPAPEVSMFPADESAKPARRLHRKKSSPNPEPAPTS